jgi:hypothetical protein
MERAKRPGKSAGKHKEVWPCDARAQRSNLKGKSRHAIGRRPEYGESKAKDALPEEGKKEKATNRNSQRTDIKWIYLCSVMRGRSKGKVCSSFGTKINM